MIDAVRQVLNEIVQNYERKIWSDPQRFKALIMDLYPDKDGYQLHSNKINILIEALASKAVDELERMAKFLPSDALLPRLSLRLESKGFEQSLTLWGIESWALALQLIQQGKAVYTPTIITVSLQQQGQYTNISAALKNAQIGDTILIQPGTYKEALILDKTLKIIGDGPQETIIVSSDNQPCLSIQTATASVHGLTLSSQASDTHKKYAAVDIQRGDLELLYCTISTTSNIGISITGTDATAKIQHCTIHGSNEYGVLIEDEGKVEINECDIFDHRIAGILVRKQARPIIHSCKIHNEWSTGIQVTNNGCAQISECEIFNNRYAGVDIKQNGNPTLQRCTIHDNAGGGIAVWMDGQGTIEDCDISRNTSVGIDIKYRGAPTIQRCKIHHNQGSGIHVWENGRGHIQNCDIFANVSCGIGIWKNGNPMVTNSRIYNERTFGIKVYDHGSGTLKDCDIFENAQIGVELRSQSNCVVENCTIQKMGNAGVLIEDCTATFTDCKIINNMRVGVIVGHKGHPTLQGCNIDHNRGQGIVFESGSEGIIEQSSICQNATTGIEIKAQGNPIIRACHINQQKRQGLKVAQGAQGLVQDCDLTLNARGAILQENGAAIRYERNTQ